MSKYEKQAWAIGVYASLGAVLLCIYHQSFVTDVFVRMLVISGFGFGFVIVAGLWRHHLIDHTETEFRISYKATAWTFYGAVVIAMALMVFLFPKEVPISRDALGMAQIYTVLIFVGIRFFLLAYLLRKERLSRPAERSPDEWTYRPHPNPLPEGEGKNDNTTQPQEPQV